MEYKGYEIFVHDGWVVLGDDPTADPVWGYTADIRQRDAEAAGDGDVVWDYPFGLAESQSTGMTQTDAIEKAKAFIDAHSRRPSD
jgi:hypothetical protein